MRVAVARVAAARGGARVAARAAAARAAVAMAVAAKVAATEAAVRVEARAEEVRGAAMAEGGRGAVMEVAATAEVMAAAERAAVRVAAVRAEARVVAVREAAKAVEERVGGANQAKGLGQSKAKALKTLKAAHVGDCFSMEFVDYDNSLQWTAGILERIEMPSTWTRGTSCWRVVHQTGDAVFEPMIPFDGGPGSVSHNFLVDNDFRVGPSGA